MDKYDKAISHLKDRHPEDIKWAWSSPGIDPAGCLFQFCSDTGEGYGLDEMGESPRYGCLTQVKSCQAEAWTPELTQEIRNDQRIPPNIASVKADDLPVFAEWQRRLDKEIRREEK